VSYVDALICRCLLLVSCCNLHSRLPKECHTCLASTSSIVTWQLATACMYCCVTSACVGLRMYFLCELCSVYTVFCLVVLAFHHMQQHASPWLLHCFKLVWLPTATFGRLLKTCFFSQYYCMWCIKDYWQSCMI